MPSGSQCNGPDIDDTSELRVIHQHHQQHQHQLNRQRSQFDSHSHHLHNHHPSFFGDAFLSSLAEEMSKPEHHLAALSWRRLHLARAKLKASSRTSALLSGFAMIAMVELQVSENVPTGLLIAFTISTTLLVSVHMLALMISTCILPNVESVASVHGLAAVSESPHEKMHFYIEIAWAFSTVFGIFLFLIELAILLWVKFWDLGKSHGHYAALSASVILFPIGVVFIGFAVHFYRTLVSHKFERSARDLQELESMISQLRNESLSGVTTGNDHDITRTRPSIINI